MAQAENWSVVPKFCGEHFYFKSYQHLIQTIEAFKPGSAHVSFNLIFLSIGADVQRLCSYHICLIAILWATSPFGISTMVI